ncbi:MAG: hypothetical protein WEG36_01600 [Gemmatimonadota bacterium]
MINAITCISPWQAGKRSGSTSQIRAKRRAQAMRLDGLGRGSGRGSAPIGGFAGRATSAAPGLPKATTIHLKHYGPAHTGWDSAIYFEQANIVHLGDLR